MASQVTTAAGNVDTVAVADSQEPRFRFNIGRILAYTFLLLGAVIAIVPFMYTVSVSLMNLTEATGGAWLPSTPTTATWL